MQSKKNLRLTHIPPYLEHILDRFNFPRYSPRETQEYIQKRGAGGEVPLAPDISVNRDIYGSLMGFEVSELALVLQLL